MPLYEYLCEPCSGIFEIVRPLREAGEPASCPVCDGDAQRVMPTTFTAFVMRQGFPRRIPDKNLYRHMGKDVTRLSTSADPFSHPDLTKPEPAPRMGKQDYVDLVDTKISARRQKRQTLAAERSLRMDTLSRQGRLKPPKGSRD